MQTRSDALVTCPLAQAMHCNIRHEKKLRVPGINENCPSVLLHVGLPRITEFSEIALRKPNRLVHLHIGRCELSEFIRKLEDLNDRPNCSVLSAYWTKRCRNILSSKEETSQVPEHRLKNNNTTLIARRFSRSIPKKNAQRSVVNRVVKVSHIRSFNSVYCRYSCNSSKNNSCHCVPPRSQTISRALTHRQRQHPTLLSFTNSSAIYCVLYIGGQLETKNKIVIDKRCNFVQKLFIW